MNFIHLLQVASPRLGQGVGQRPVELQLSVVRKERAPLLACGPFYLSQVSSFSCSSVAQQSPESPISFLCPSIFIGHLACFFREIESTSIQEHQTKESEIRFSVWVGDNKGKGRRLFLSPDLVEFKVFAV